MLSERVDAVAETAITNQTAFARMVKGQLWTPTLQINLASLNQAPLRRS
jgi:hypothetical protein